jgi:hypothetical protein
VVEINHLENKNRYSSTSEAVSSISSFPVFDLLLLLDLPELLEALLLLRDVFCLAPSIAEAPLAEELEPLLF